MTTGFGLWRSCPDDAPIAWGARAIVEVEHGAFSVCLVHDRQSTRGDATALCKRMNAGPIGSALKRASEVFLRGEWSGDGLMAKGDVTLYDADGLVIVGNPNESGGYLYMIAYERSDP